MALYIYHKKAYKPIKNQLNLEVRGYKMAMPEELGEALRLYDIVNNLKGQKSMLDSKVDELLKGYNFNILKKHKDMNVYAKEGNSNTLFIEYGFKEEGNTKYCFAVLKDNPDTKGFNKNLKIRLLDKNTLREYGILGLIWGGGTLLGLVVDYLTGTAGTDGIGMATASGFFGGGLAASLTMISIHSKTVAKAEKELEGMCKKIYYGKAALEEAFKTEV